LQVLAKAYAYGRQRFTNEKEEKQRLQELEQENQNLKAMLNITE
jgi:cell shape-determining protein MreC